MKLLLLAASIFSILEAGASAAPSLSAFFGNYDVLQQDGKPVVPSGKFMGQDFSCEIFGQIGKANLERAIAPKSPDMSRTVETLLADFFDLTTKAPIAAEQLWVSPGIITGSSGIEACDEVNFTVFPDRGEWNQSADTDEYRFNGKVAHKDLDGSFSEKVFSEHIVAKSVGTKQVELSVDDGAGFRKTWLLQKK